MIVKLTTIEPVVVGSQLAMAFLSPVSAYALGRSLELDARARRIVVASSVLYPLGFGLYLSTRSTFHKYYLAFPVAVLFVSWVVRVSKRTQVMRRDSLVVQLLGLTTVLFHPLAFVAATVLGGSIFFVRRFTSRTVPLTIRSLSRSTFQVVVLFAPLAVYSIWFAIVETNPIFLTNVFLIVGLLSGLGSGSSATCLSGIVVDACGVAWTGKIAVFLALFGAAVAVTVIIGFQILYESRWDELRKRALLFLVVLTGYAGGIVTVFATGIIGRNILIRLLSFGALAALLAVVVGVSKLRIRSVSKVVRTLYIAGTVTAVATTGLLFSADPRLGSIAGIVTAAAIAVGFPLWLAPSRARVIGQFGVLIIVVSSLIVLYPAPTTNATPNPAPSAGTIPQHEWVGARLPADAQYAAGQLEWKIYRYANPDGDDEPFRSSQWIYSTFALTDNQSLVSVSRTFAGSQSERRPDYVLHRPYYESYTGLRYEQGGVTYRTNLPVTDRRILASYQSGNRIYANGNGVIYQVS